jgi:hypothetical protein
MEALSQPPIYTETCAFPNRTALAIDDNRSSILIIDLSLELVTLLLNDSTRFVAVARLHRMCVMTHYMVGPWMSD